MSDETSSDTLRDDLEKAWDRYGPTTFGVEEYKAIAERAIEDAAQLEAEVENHKACASSWCSQYDSMVNHAREVEAERDRLHDLLDYIYNVEDSGCSIQEKAEYVEDEVQEALRGVERGDTVDRIRHEALEEAAERAVFKAKEQRQTQPVTRIDQARHDGAMMASRAIRDLADDDQEGEIEAEWIDEETSGDTRRERPSDEDLAEIRERVGTWVDPEVPTSPQETRVGGNILAALDALERAEQERDRALETLEARADDCAPDTPGAKFYRQEARRLRALAEGDQERDGDE